MDGRYVLLTAAKDEGAYIEKTIDSVAAQTLLPARWVVVNDGSQDETGAILRDSAARLEFLQVLDRPRESTGRNFASKAEALRLAWDAVQGLDYDYVGVLDADVEIPTNFYAEMLSGLARSPDLGVTGGWVCELVNGEFRPCSTNRLNSVEGCGCQTFRRECYEHIGGIPSLRHGGEDTLAQLLVEMGGWRACSNKDVRVNHLKPSVLAAGSWIRLAYDEGLRAYFLGYHPAYALAKAVRRIPDPFVRAIPLPVPSLCRLRNPPRAARSAPGGGAVFRNKQMAALMPWRSRPKRACGEVSLP